MKWTDIIGHSEQIKMLRHMEASRRVPHAILFSGPGGIGKSMVASVLGAALLCLAPESRPCGKCQSCLQILYHTHPDLLMMSPDGLGIKIEQIRKLQHEVMLAPYMSSRRVCIIDGAELMTVQAANSLLKVLEEPIGDVVFILISSNRQMLLTTILSRCLDITFQPLNNSSLTQALVDRGFSSKQSEAAARLSRGRMGEALLMLESGGFGARDQAADIMEGLLEGTMSMVWDRAAMLEKMERKELLQLVGYMSYLLRDMLLISAGQGCNLLFNMDLADKLGRMAESWDEQKLVKALQAVETARRALNGNANGRLTSEALLIKIYDVVREV